MADPARLEAHPAANAYRLMTDDELADLAASVAVNGLRDPITVGVLDGKRFIADGRNRLKACEMAGVEPRFNEIVFKTEDDLRAFVADRSERRSITAGQKAMGHAMLFPEAGKGGRGKKGPTQSGGFGADFLRMARAVLAYSPELAAEVRDGATPLKQAYETARDAGVRSEIAESQRQRLAQEAPDLAVHVKEEKLTLDEAIAKLEQREQDERKLRSIKERSPDLVKLVNEGRMSVADALAPNSGRLEKDAAAKQGARIMVTDMVLHIERANNSRMEETIADFDTDQWPTADRGRLTVERVAALVGITQKFVKLLTQHLEKESAQNARVSLDVVQGGKR
jgi:hypothetical protein